jgi:demethylmenaquinone methyltransferase/2-methoxy-6-polyprenyl-1,4-benzoquinol methylase
MEEKKKVVKPYGKDDASKKEEVAEMFNNISEKYDYLNHLLSMGIDKLWRRKAVKILKEYNPKKVLDVATGTGDFAIAALKLKPDSVIGVDISKGMIKKGNEKLCRKGIQDKVVLQIGDSEKLDFKDDTFDGLTVGFGVRNYEDLEKGLSEMKRVLKPGGVAIILEFSKPKKFPVKQGFSIYSKYIIPKVGKSVSKDTNAYAYLPESVAAFPEGQDFLDILAKVGYKNTRSKMVSGGIATIYIGEK